MNRVHHEPLSWLTLERYALGELDALETRRVEAQLAHSPEDRACLESILADDSELPALPIPLRAPRRRAPFWGATASLVAAAALLLVLLRPGDTALLPVRHVQEGSKGGDVALSLRSDRQSGEPRTFSAGERFKVLVTAPAWFERPLRVVVFQDGQRFEPLPAGVDLARGNRVPWPSAFSLDGGAPAEVCVTWSTEPQTALRAADLGEAAVCTELQPR